MKAGKKPSAVTSIKECEQLLALAQEIESAGGQNADAQAQELLEQLVRLSPDNVAAVLEVRGDTVRRNVDRVMPFTATERWLMLGVKAGGDRQKLHEVIRVHSRAVADAIEKGESNNLLDRLSADPGFKKVDAAQLRAELDPAKYVGRAPEQVDEYLAEVLEPLLDSLKTYDVAETAEVAV